jgi:FolB domain-containing protein
MNMPLRQSLHSLKIRDFTLPVRLGVSPEERANPQEVRVSVEIHFFAPPLATSTDQLNDTVSYARICEAIRKHVEAHEFKLIEKLANDLFEISRSVVGTAAEVSLVLHKIKPPVEGLLGGAEYRIGNHR